MLYIYILFNYFLYIYIIIYYFLFFNFKCMQASDSLIITSVQRRKITQIKKKGHAYLGGATTELIVEHLMPNSLACIDEPVGHLFVCLFLKKNVVRERHCRTHAPRHSVIAVGLGVDLFSEGG